MPNVRREQLHWFYWADEAGNVIGPVEFANEGMAPPPPGAATMTAREPLTLRETLYAVDPETGGLRELGVGSSTYSADLALALAYSSNGLSLADAIIVAATACERCGNALAHQGGLEWGYPEFGPEWQDSPTECAMCIPPEAATRWPNGTRARFALSWERTRGLPGEETREAYPAGTEAEVVSSRSAFDHAGNFEHHLYGLRLDPDEAREEGDSGRLLHWVPEPVLERLAQPPGDHPPGREGQAQQLRYVPPNPPSPADPVQANFDYWEGVAHDLDAEGGTSDEERHAEKQRAARERREREGGQ